VLPLASGAWERLERLEGQRDASAGSLEQLVSRHRDGLLAGRRVSTPDQEQALLRRGRLKQQEAQAEEEMVRLVAPRLARLLAGGQVRRAWLLANGDWPERVPRSPALLEPESGFVVGSDRLQEWREGMVRQALYRRYPRALVEGLPRSYVVGDYLNITSSIALLGVRAFTRDSSLSGDLEILTEPADPQVEGNEQDARRQRALRETVRREAEALKARREEVTRQFTVGAAEEELARSLVPLARRLLLSPRFRTMLRERIRRTGGNAGALWEPESEPEDRSGRLVRRWEEMLLLEALRYLQLSPEQLERLLPLTGLAEQRLGEVGEKARPTLMALERAAARHRIELLQGRALPPEEQEQVVAAAKSLRAQREEAEEKTAREIAGQLVRILTRDQIARALLLLQGAWPGEEPRSPLLLDRSSGFVLEEAESDQLRDRAVRQALQSRYPAAAVDGALGRGDRLVINVGEGLYTRAATTALFLDAVKMQGAAPPQARLPFPAAMQEAARRDRDRMNERWDRLAELLEQGATEEELALALRPLVRRTFPSPRLRTVLRERLSTGGPLVEEEVLPATRPMDQ
jgi:hypothetical protein